jgi:enoyl-CoA hydratase
MSVIIETDPPVYTVIINRPQARNAVNPETADRLVEAFTRFDRDPEFKVAVLTGSQGTFCAGFDLTVAAQESVVDRYQPEGQGPMGPSRMLLSKPTIAAVEGHAVAGGLELALWCDLRVASQTAVFGVFCRRWGVPLLDGGTVRLPRLIGQSRALDMILTGRPVAADEALAWGLANRVVPEGAARAAAEDLARSIAAFPQVCLRTDRRSALEQWDLPLMAALKFEGRRGLTPLIAETRAGAARFVGGQGRHGAFEKS